MPCGQAMPCSVAICPDCRGGRVVHWGVLDAHNALFIAASRIACIEIAVVQLALLSMLISPDVASERVSVLTARSSTLHNTLPSLFESILHSPVYCLMKHMYGAMR